MKVVTLVGTRPEIIKLAQTIKELDRFFEHILVHTGQNFDYELNEIFFKDLELRKPDYFLDAAGQTPAKTIANVISKFDDVLEKENPDALLIYGDTDSCLGAVAAKRRKIPIFHMEAGNRCFDLNVPEEINRKIVDHLSDINMVLCEQSRKYLEAEGIRPETIIKTGSSMKELLSAYADKIKNSDILKRLKLKEKEYFVVSAHRQEVVDDEENLKSLMESLNALIEKYGYPVIFSLHPRTRKKLNNIKGLNMSSRITFMKPLGFFDYINLQKNAFCTLSDSGTITEESSILNFSAVTTRNIHERPEGNDEGTLIMCGYKKERVLFAVDMVTRQEARIKTIKDYEADNVSIKVARIIAGYADYIDRTVWKKRGAGK